MAPNMISWSMNDPWVLWSIPRATGRKSIEGIPGSHLLTDVKVCASPRKNRQWQGSAPAPCAVRTEAFVARCQLPHPRIAAWRGI